MMGSMVALRRGRVALLQAEVGDRGLTPLGILLEDSESNQLYLRLRRDLDTLDPDDPVLPLLEEDLRSKGEEMGAEGFFAWAEEHLSANLRTTEREEVVGADFDRMLARLYAERIGSKYSSAAHVPRYSLRAAAGKFLENAEAEIESYEELPEHIRPKTGQFAAHIAGTSMEPMVPDGSVVLFEMDVKGSRQNRFVLIEESGSRFTLKKYTSRKAQSDDGTWRHDEIVLEPLNNEHDPIVLSNEDSRYRVIAWFVDVLY